MNLRQIQANLLQKKNTVIPLLIDELSPSWLDSKINQPPTTNAPEWAWMDPKNWVSYPKIAHIRDQKLQNYLDHFKLCLAQLDSNSFQRIIWLAKWISNNTIIHVVWLQPLDLMTKFRFSHSLETDWTKFLSICLTKQIGNHT